MIDIYNLQPSSSTMLDTKDNNISIIFIAFEVGKLVLKDSLDNVIFVPQQQYNIYTLPIGTGNYKLEYLDASYNAMVIAVREFII